MKTIFNDSTEEGIAIAVINAEEKIQKILRKLNKKLQVRQLCTTSVVISREIDFTKGEPETNFIPKIKLEVRYV